MITLTVLACVLVLLATVSILKFFAATYRADGILVGTTFVLGAAWFIGGIVWLIAKDKTSLLWIGGWLAIAFVWGFLTQWAVNRKWERSSP